MIKTENIPTNDRIAELSSLLSKHYADEKTHRQYAPIKNILTCIGVAGTLALTLFVPGIAPITKNLMNVNAHKRKNDWIQFNPYFLKRSITRLQKQKMVEIREENGIQCISLTTKGKRRILKYAMTDMEIEKPKQWDERWRLIIYDVADNHKKMRDLFRNGLKSLGFFQLQKSVWIYPYPCETQITFLREYYGVGNEVLYAITENLEDDTPYREYFGVGES